MKRKGRLYVTCTKVPKHKQRQGFHTAAEGAFVAETGCGVGATGWGGGAATAWAAHQAEAGAGVCCCPQHGHSGGAGGVAGLVFSGNYR